MSSDDDDVIILTTTTSATTISRPLSRQPSNGSNKYNFNSTGFANAIGLSTKVGSVSTAVSRTTSTGSITNHVATSKGIARAATKVDIDLSTDEDELPAFLQLKPRAVDKGKGKAVDQVAAANGNDMDWARQAAPPPAVAVAVAAAPVQKRVPAKRPLDQSKAAILQRNSMQHGPAPKRSPERNDDHEAREPAAKKGKQRAEPISDSDEEDAANGKRPAKKAVKKVGARASSASPPKKVVAAKAPKKSVTADSDKAAKAAHAAVNVLQHDRKKTVAEISLHLSGTAFAADMDLDVLGQQRRAREEKSTWLDIAQEIKSRMEPFDCHVEIPKQSKEELCEGMVRWTRMCDRRWDEANRCFVPLGEGNHILAEEDSRLVFITAAEVGSHVESGALIFQMDMISSALPARSNLILMIYGLRVYLRSLKANRKEEILLAIERAQVDKRCCVVRVETVDEAVDWLEQLSMDVGAKYYQRIKKSHAAILGVTSTEKIPSGTGEQDTYLKMLASIKGLTKSIAEGIGSVYPTFRSLYDAYGKQESEQARITLLCGAKKSQNVNGTASDRMVGNVISERVYRVLTGVDENASVTS